MSNQNHHTSKLNHACTSNVYSYIVAKLIIFMHAHNYVCEYVLV